MANKRGPWTVQSSDEKYRNPFIDVREDQVHQPDGQPGTYATVTMKPGVAVLPIDENNTVYLTRQFRYALDKESIEAISGGVDHGESPQEAAQREAREELGIEAHEWVDLGVMDIDTSIVRAPVHLFLARNVSFTETQREGTETIETMKIPFKDVVRMVMESAITHGPSCVLILKANIIHG